MIVDYKLTFIKGSAPFYKNISEIYFRPISYLESSLNYFKVNFSDLHPYHARLSGNVTDMIRDLQVLLRFPKDVSHSMDAFGDYLSDLSWLGTEHIILIVELVDGTKNIDNYMIIDALAWTINMLNIERKMTLSILVLI